MDHNIFFNHHALPAQDRESAYRMLFDACQGVLHMRGAEGRIFLYYDAPGGKSIHGCELAENYTYQAFLDALLTRNEQDLYLFLLECDDKSPAFNQFDHGMQEELLDCRCYLPNRGYAGSLDALCMAYWLEPQAVLLSLPTATEWSTPSVEFLMTQEGLHKEEHCSLRNISGEQDGDYWRRAFEQSQQQSLSELCPDCLFSTDFDQWFRALEMGNQDRIREKLSLANRRQFQGGRPLFESLHGSQGLREIRLSAFQGGAIRILFKTCAGRYAILTGFIKKSDHEGYEESIRIAEQAWSLLCSAQVVPPSPG